MIAAITLLNIVLVPIDSALPVSPARFVECKVRPEESPHDGPSEHGHGIGPDQFTNECHRAVLQHPHDVLPHEVEVFLAHVHHLVLHFSGVVDDYERTLSALRFLVELVVLVNGVELLKEGFIGRTWEAETK